MHKPEIYSAIAAAVFYNPDTGSFTWRAREGGDRATRSWNSRYALTECGTIDSGGYRVIRIQHDRRTYRLKAHRVAWFIATGAIPDYEIDHINRIQSDNRICNLRDSKRSENQRNRSMARNNTSGVTGVHYNKKEGKWHALVRVDGKKLHVGYFSDLSAADEAIKDFRKKNGFTDDHGEKRPTSSKWRDRAISTKTKKECA